MFRNKSRLKNKTYMTVIKNKVNPEDLEHWFTNNRSKVYERSVETASLLVKNLHLEQEILFEFYWDDNVYAKIYMNKKDVKTAMEKALNFFVEQEMYEKAQACKDIKDLVV